MLNKQHIREALSRYKLATMSRLEQAEADHPPENTSELEAVIAAIDEDGENPFTLLQAMVAHIHGNTKMGLRLTEEEIILQGTSALDSQPFRLEVDKRSWVLTVAGTAFHGQLLREAFPVIEARYLIGT